MRQHPKHRRSLNITDLVHDVEDVRIVINLDYPPQAEDYIHRIGRTARSGAKGTAYSFFTRDNAKQAQELIQVLKDSNQDVNEKLYEMAKTKYFGNGSGRGGGGYRGGFDRRGPPNNNRHDDRGANSYGGGGARPSRFSNKRSRSRSPPMRVSRFDNRDGNDSHSYNGHTNDYKRARTDHSRPAPEEPPRHPYSSATNGSAMKPPASSASSSSTNNPYSGFYNHAAAYAPPPPASMYPAAYQMYAQAASQQPPLPTGPPPS